MAMIWHSQQARLAVIFDVDGILVDSYRVHFESWLSLTEEHGTIMTETEFASLFGRTSRDIICKILGPDLSEQQVVAMDDRKEALYREFLQRKFPVMDGAVELIDSLVEAGFVLAVGSSGPPENVNISLRWLGRTQSFSAIVTGKDVTRGKPDPQVFLLSEITKEKLFCPTLGWAHVHESKWTESVAARPVKCPVSDLTGVGNKAFVEKTKERPGIRSRGRAINIQ